MTPQLQRQRKRRAEKKEDRSSLLKNQDREAFCHWPITFTVGAAFQTHGLKNVLTSELNLVRCKFLTPEAGRMCQGVYKHEVGSSGWQGCKSEGGGAGGGGGGGE